MPNRTSPPAVLLRESYRDEQGRAQKRTLANLSKLPGDIVDGLKVLLKGGTVIGTGPDEMRVARSLPHGHVAFRRWPPTRGRCNCRCSMSALAAERQRKREELADRDRARSGTHPGAGAA